MQMLNVPAELRALKQWVMWKSEVVEGSKPTKVPYQVNGSKADVNRSETWNTFEECYNCLQHGLFTGIGFVFSSQDPYTFIDLDDAEGDASIIERHLKIYHEFNSYAEVSPSGKGLHIIVKGIVPTGRRRSKIEIYSSQRYATMTGNVYNDKPIADCQDVLTMLWQQMGEVKTPIAVTNEDQKLSDEEIIAMASSATNGEKFHALHTGNWKELYSSQSEADYAYVDMLSFYSRNVQQIERIFLASPLGQRTKAKRKDYISGMVRKSFDNQLPTIDIEGYSNQVSTSPATPTVIAPANKNKPVTFPPGLTGEIAQFILDAAPRPVPEIALAGAIALMAGITGRAYNVSGTGLNHYILLLAMTGTGKEAAAAGINKLINTIRLQVPTATSFVGPSEISSGQALIKHLASESQSFVSLLGEFGLRLQVMSHHNANSSDLSLRRLLLELYNRSGAMDTTGKSIYSDKANNTAAVNSPSFSMFGETVPDEYYKALDEGMISQGLLPRFIHIEYKGDRSEYNRNHQNAQPSFQLIERLSTLCAHCEVINHSNPRQVINVQYSPEAEVLLDSFNTFADAKLRDTTKNVIRHLWNRAHVKLLKLSALISVGINPFEPVITPETVHWCADIIQRDIITLTEKFESGEVGLNSSELHQQAFLIKVIREYVTFPFDRVERYIQTSGEKLHRDKVIPYIYLNKRLSSQTSFKDDRAGATNAIKRSIQTLIDSDRLKELHKAQTLEKYGTNQKCFIVWDNSLLTAS